MFVTAIAMPVNSSNERERESFIRFFTQQEWKMMA